MLRLFIVLAILISVASAQLCIPTIAPGTASSVMGQPTFTDSNALSTLNNFDAPTGIVVEPTSQKVFVADANNRIQRFNSTQALVNGSVAELFVFGNSSATCSAETLSGPQQIAISGSVLYIADLGGNRVLRVNGVTNATSTITAASHVYGQLIFTNCMAGSNVTGPDFNSPNGVAVTDNGTLWVADTNNFYLKRFDNILSAPNHPNPDGLLGTGVTTPVNASNIVFPSFLSVDKTNGNLFVADTLGFRVMFYLSAHTKANNAQADKVFGQSTFTDQDSTVNQSTIRRPNGIFYDSPTDSLFVTDLGVTNERSRILVWTNTLLQQNGSSASFVIGRPDFTSSGTPGATSGSAFDTPWDVAYSNEFPGVFLLVVDQANNRVVRFECTNATFTSTKSLSNSVPPSSPGSSSGAALSSSAPVAPSSSGAVAASSSGAVAASSSGVVAASSSGAVAASSSGAVAASSSGAVAPSSSIIAASSSGAPAASSAVVGTQSRSKSGVIAASSGASVAASSGAVAASSGAVPASSGAAAGSSSGAAAVTPTRSSSKSQSNTPSETRDVTAVSSGVVAASSGATAGTSLARSNGATDSKSISVAKSRTLTGRAAINCRQQCQLTFKSCKRTTRRLRTCRRAKKRCVSQCGVVNPRRF